jgi:DEAD/DEAH box helicase domain-containing protein
MNVGDFFAQVVRESYYHDQVAHVEVLPERPARYGKVSGGLHPAVQAVLAKRALPGLYSHQAEAIGISGRAQRRHRHRHGERKTLCHNLPVLEAAGRSAATMLYLSHRARPGPAAHWEAARPEQA